MTINHEFFHDCLRTTDFGLIITRDSLSALFAYWQKQHKKLQPKIELFYFYFRQRKYLLDR